MQSDPRDPKSLVHKEDDDGRETGGYGEGHHSDVEPVPAEQAGRDAAGSVVRLECPGTVFETLFVAEICKYVAGLKKVK